MTRLERALKRRLDDLTETLLNGGGEIKDFTSYREIASRRLELQWVLDTVVELRGAHGDDIDDDRDASGE